MCLRLYPRLTSFVTVIQHGNKGNLVGCFTIFHAFLLVILAIILLVVYWKQYLSMQFKEKKTMVRYLVIVCFLACFGVIAASIVNHENDIDQSRDYKDLVYTLRKYDLLPNSATRNGTCLILVKITKDEILSKDDEPFVSMGIRLYFEEEVTGAGARDNFAEQEQGKGKTIATIRNQIDNISSRVTVGNCKGSKKDLVNSGFEMAELKQDNVTLAKMDAEDGDSNETVVAYAQPPVKDQETDEDAEGGFGRTQVVVIATCSAVVGTFFIIAGVMRIQGCVKRYRANRDSVLNGAGRSSTGNLNGDNFGRRPSGESKTSRQSKDSDNDESEDDEEARLVPSLEQPEKQHNATFLLPVSDQTLGDLSSSQISFEFIDESAQLEAGGDRTSSGHREEHDTVYVKPECAIESSINVAMEDDNSNKNQNEYMTPCVDAVTSQLCDDVVSMLSEEMTICTKEKTSQQCDNAASSTREVDSPRRSLDRNVDFEPDGDNDVKINAVTNKNGDEPLKSDVDSGVEVTTQRSKSIDSTKEYVDDSDQPSLLDLSRGLSTDSSEYDFDTGFPIYKRKSSASRQYSVDYFEVDENGIEIYNPIFEEDENEHSNEETSVSPLFDGMVTTGFHQSDNSLNENPSYCYGNQVEYGVNGDYNPQYYFSYCHNEADVEMDLINKCACAKKSSDSQKTKSFSVCEPVMKELSLFQETEEELTKVKVSRMLSSDSYFRSKSRSRTNTNGVSIDQSNNVFTISSQSNVKSEIVPLSIYKRNSLKQSRITRDESDNDF